MAVLPTLACLSGESGRANLRESFIELAHEGEFVVVPWAVQVEVEIARDIHGVFPGSVPGKVAQDLNAVGWGQINDNDIEFGGTGE